MPSPSTKGLSASAERSALRQPSPFCIVWPVVATVMVQRKCGGTELGSEVLLVLEKQATVGRVVQIPGAGGEFIQHIGFEGGKIANPPVDIRAGREWRRVWWKAMRQG